MQIWNFFFIYTILTNGITQTFIQLVASYHVDAASFSFFLGVVCDSELQYRPFSDADVLLARGPVLLAGIQSESLLGTRSSTGWK